MTKRIVITGASQGLGLAMAEALIAEGHTVAGCSRSPDRMRELADRFGDGHIFAPVNVSDNRQVRDFAALVLERNGPPDLLINNAGVMNDPRPLWNVDARDFSTVIDVNVKGVFHSVRHFLPAMLERRSGVVVNFSSGWGRSTAPEVASYCASKWAVEGLTLALAQELPAGLAAVSLNPGIINTQMLRKSFGNAASNYPSADRWARVAVPLLLGLGPRHNGQQLEVPHPDDAS